MLGNNRIPVGDDSWIKIFQFLPDRMINLYCFIFSIKSISKTMSFLIFILNYIFLIVLILLIVLIVLNLQIIKN